jgi:outer membrane protein assembly factor BamB
MPFTDDGVNEPGSGYEVPCDGGQVPACPDATLASNPTRAVSLHALDAATGAVVWQAPSLPTYAAATYAGGVVFAPSTVGFSADAYDADTGVPLWSFPMGGAAASGMAIVGASVFVGAGLAFESEGGAEMPPQMNGVWSFGLPLPAQL